MNSDFRGGFGGANSAAVQKVRNKGAENLSVAESGTRTAFLDAWTRTLTAHASYLRKQGETLDAPVIVAYVNDCAHFAEDHGWSVRPLLGTAPTDSYAGMLIAATGGHGGCLHSDSFGDTSKFESAIDSAGLGETLTIGLMSTDQLFVWRQGLRSGVVPYARTLMDGLVLIDDTKICSDLNIFYEEEARQSKKWWRDASKRITVEEPEKTVQDDLRLFLVGRYAELARVREEDISGNGRTDITILPLGEGQDSSVLELKTIRDYHTPKNSSSKPQSISLDANKKWAASGIQQVAAYRDKEKFGYAFLCVYDFCKQQGADLEAFVTEEADKYKVIALRFWITSTHVEHREDRYPL